MSQNLTGFQEGNRSMPWGLPASLKSPFFKVQRKRISQGDWDQRIEPLLRQAPIRSGHLAGSGANRIQTPSPETWDLVPLVNSKYTRIAHDGQ